MTSAVMICRELVALAREERARFREHPAACPEGARYLRSYEVTTALAKGAFTHPDDPVAADVPQEPVRAILAVRLKA